jgi:hypothetical protein
VLVRVRVTTRRLGWSGSSVPRSHRSWVGTLRVRVTVRVTVRVRVGMRVTGVRVFGRNARRYDGPFGSHLFFVEVNFIPEERDTKATQDQKTERERDTRSKDQP